MSAVWDYSGLGPCESSDFVFVMANAMPAATALESKTLFSENERAGVRGDHRIILGIDPGLATMGWGVIEADGYREKRVQYGALITYPRDTFPVRLRCIYKGVQELLKTFQPDEIAFEELFFSKNVTTGIQVGGARGVALVACQEYTDKLFEYTPMQIKQAVVGYGGADKHQVQMMVRMLLGIKEIPKPDDAADAVACAITHAHAGAGRVHFRIK